MPKLWIDISLRKPQEGEQALVACMNGRGSKSVNLGTFTKGRFIGTGTSAKVIYWMKIPDLPEFPKKEMFK